MEHLYHPLSGSRNVAEVDAKMLSSGHNAVIERTVSQQLCLPELSLQKVDKSLGLGLSIPQKVLKANSTSAVPSRDPSKAVPVAISMVRTVMEGLIKDSRVFRVIHLQ